MHVDNKTRRDLEIFQTRDHGPGVFQGLDLTKTPGGSRALRTRFENPFSDPARIREVQAGIQFLCEEKIQFFPDPALIGEVRRYIDSSWDVGTRARGLRFLIESIVVAIRYRDLLRDVMVGVAATRQLASRLIPFLRDILAKDPPPEIQSPVEELLGSVERLYSPLGKPHGSPWAVFRADRSLRLERKAELQRSIDLLSELDALIAMAAATTECGFVLPEIVDGSAFVLAGEGVFHPALEDAVGNPVRMSDQERLVFLTGPNMAGKTTYLRAVAIAAFLAHLGMGVPASCFRISTLDSIYSSLSPEEDLRAGLSYFMAEVRRVRHIAEALARGERAFVVIDEVFRGTNVKDALDASGMAIRGFARSRTGGFIVLSHLVELADDLKALPEVRFAHFDGEIREGLASYQFRLKDGVSNQRFGLVLLEQEGVPELLDSLEARS
ncbi:MAG: hypothetical protein PVJ76_07610 [Gemmatimonadota bacterium]